MAVSLVTAKARPISSALAKIFGGDSMGVVGDYGRQFNDPRSLFTSGAQGAWYDPSDYSTMFEDAAGTIPITTPLEKPVGLMLDKSGRGNHAYQSTTTSRPTLSARYNLLGYTQEFDNAAWTKSNSFVQTNQIRNNTMQGAVAGSPGTLPTNWSAYTALTGLTRQVVDKGVDGGVTYVDIRLSGTPSSAGTYAIYFDSGQVVAALTGQAWTPSTYLKVASGSLSGINFIRNVLQENSSSGSYVTIRAGSQRVIDATLTRYSDLLTLAGGATTAFVQPYIDLNLTGAAIDITLRIGMPQLVQGASAGDVVATYGTAKAVMYQAPDGTLSADKLVEDTTVTNEHRMGSVNVSWTGNGVYTASFYAKAAGRSKFDILFGTSGNWVSGEFGRMGNFDVQNGTVRANPAAPAVASIAAVGNGWYRCRITATTTASPTTSPVFIRLCDDSGSATYTGDGTSGIFIWGADLRVANDGVDLPAYQRVNTATDYDYAGFAPADVFDGVDDHEITAAGGGSTTAFFWCSSIRVGKVGAVQTLFSDTGTNTGYRVRINASNQLELAAGNNTAYTTATTSDTLALGQRAVLTAWHDGANLNVQINNGTVVQTAFATATAGTAQITIGKDNNAASSYFMGPLYEKVYLKDTVLSAANIAATKSFCAQKAKVTL